MRKFLNWGENKLFSQIAATFTETRKNTLFSFNLGKVDKTNETLF